MTPDDWKTLPQLSSHQPTNEMLHMNDFFRLVFHQRKKLIQNDIDQKWRGAFVRNYKSEMAKLRRFDQVFFGTLDGMKFFVHTRSIKARSYCAVRKLFNCPHCPINFPKFAHSLRSHPKYGDKFNNSLRTAILKLDMQSFYGEFALLHFDEETKSEEETRVLNNSPYPRPVNTAQVNSNAELKFDDLVELANMQSRHIAELSSAMHHISSKVDDLARFGWGIPESHETEALSIEDSADTTIRRGRAIAAEEEADRAVIKCSGR